MTHTHGSEPLQPKLSPSANRDFHVGDVVRNRNCSADDRHLVTTTGAWESRFYELVHCPHEGPGADLEERVAAIARRRLPCAELDDEPSADDGANVCLARSRVGRTSVLMIPTSGPLVPSPDWSPIGEPRHPWPPRSSS